MKSEFGHWLVAAIIVILISGTAVSLWAAQQEDNSLREQLVTQTRLSYMGITTGQVAALTGSEADLTSPDYLALKKQMGRLRAANPNIRFTYLIGKRSDEAYFFFVDSEPPESRDYSPPGQEYPDVTTDIIDAFATGKEQTAGPVTDRWGTWISSVVPVADPKTGKILAVFGMDVDARDWYGRIGIACLPAVMSTLLILVLVLTFFFIQQRNDRERRRLKASEQVIRDSEERYRLLVTRSPVGIVQIDKNGIIIAANQKFADITGVPPERLTGFNTLTQIQNPALAAAIKESLGGNTGFFEGDYTSLRSGKRSILRMVSQPVSTGDGRFSGSIGIFEDITERRQAEEREKQQTTLFLRTQQALVRMAKLPSDNIDAFFHQIILIDAKTIGVRRVSVWLFSESMSELICIDGYDSSSGSHSCSMRMKRADYPLYFAALDENRIIAAHDARHDEHTAEFLDSYLLPFNITSVLDVPVRRGGQMVGIIRHEHTGQTRIWDPLEQEFTAAVADLVSSALERAERMAAEEALRESEVRYRSVVEDQTELISRFEPDGTHVFVNDAYCRFFRIDRSQIIGKKFFPDIPPDDQILVRKHFVNLSSEVPVAEISHRIIMPDGQIRWLRWVDRAIFNNRGDIVEYQSVGRDITWQKQIEDALFVTNQKLNLLSSITRHDVLNQLLVLNGYLHLSTKNKTDPEKTHDFIEKAMKAAKAIENQIRFTRDYQEMGSKVPSWQNVNECIVHAKGGLPVRDLRIELHRQGLEVLADPLLEKVFYNLFDNAIRHGGEQMKTIRVSSIETQNGLVIVCEDDGTGIAESDKKYLFTRGFGKNTGFGLFLSREILMISGISIKEISMPGTGARFEITVQKGGYRFAEKELKNN